MSIVRHIKPIGAGVAAASIVAIASNLTGTLFEVLQHDWVLPALIAGILAGVSSTWTFRPLLLSGAMLLLVLCSALAVLLQREYLAALALVLTIAVLIGFLASALLKSSSSRER